LLILVRHLLKTVNLEKARYDKETITVADYAVEIQLSKEAVEIIEEKDDHLTEEISSEVNLPSESA